MHSSREKIINIKNLIYMYIFFSYSLSEFSHLIHTLRPFSLALLIEICLMTKGSNLEQLSFE